MAAFGIRALQSSLLGGCQRHWEVDAKGRVQIFEPASSLKTSSKPSFLYVGRKTSRKAANNLSTEAKTLAIATVPRKPCAYPGSRFRERPFWNLSSLVSSKKWIGGDDDSETSNQCISDDSGNKWSSKANGVASAPKAGPLDRDDGNVGQSRLKAGWSKLKRWAQKGVPVTRKPTQVQANASGTPQDPAPNPDGIPGNWKGQNDGQSGHPDGDMHFGNNPGEISGGFSGGASGGSGEGNRIGGGSSGGGDAEPNLVPASVVGDDEEEEHSTKRWHRRMPRLSALFASLTSGQDGDKREDSAEKGNEEDKAEGEGTDSAEMDDLATSETPVEVKPEARQPLEMISYWLSKMVRGFASGRASISEVETPEEEVRDYLEEEDRAALLRSAELVVEILDERTGDDAIAHRAEVSALRRLQREAFADLLRLRERVEKLEHLLGLDRDQAPNGASLVGAFAARLQRTRLLGEVTAGGAYVPVESSEGRSAQLALEQAGVRTGLDIKFRFETPCREADLLVTECTSGWGDSSRSALLGGPVILQKVMYTAALLESLVLRLSPLGANGGDMADNLNPLQGRGLTKFTSECIPMLRSCEGAAASITFQGCGAKLTAAQFLDGWGAVGPGQSLSSGGSGLCSSTLGQVALQPHDRLQLAFSMISRFWPAPPLPSATTAMHWSEMGPLVLPKINLSFGQGNSGAQLNGSANSTHFVDLQPGPQAGRGGIVTGTSLQLLALAGSADLGPLGTASGWAQAEQAEWLHEEDRQNMQWGVSLSHSPSKRWPLGWGLSIGSSQQDMWPPASSIGEEVQRERSSPQMQMEASLIVACGRGLVLQPGYVRTLHGTKEHTALLLRSTWEI